VTEGASRELRAWSESAPYWAKHREVIRTMFAPISAALIQEVPINEGQVVLDVAGGVGDPSLTIARICRPSGWVACSDAVAEMVATAKREAQLQGIENLHAVQCLSEGLPFQDNAFDAAVSRLGLMFSSDPLLSLREMLRVIRPGRRMSLAVWNSSEFNPFFTVTAKVVARYLPMPSLDPDAPGAFRFGEQGKLAKLLTRAGAIEVVERNLRLSIEASVKLKDFWTVRSEMSEVLRSKAAQLSLSQLAAVERDVQKEASEFFSSGRMSFPAEILLVSGTRAPPSR
jgi:SAM-dependent methyltransferase